MGETLFSFDRRNFHECQGRYRGDRDQEYYRGDCWIEDGSKVEVRSERRAVGPVSIIRQRSASNLFFRRTWQHIREDATDLSILWFVRYGQITLTDQFGSRTVPAGGFALTRSTTPFFMACRTDDDSVHEVLHVTVPTHVLRKFIPCDHQSSLAMPTKPVEIVIAENILTDTFEDDGALGTEAAQLLTDTALKLIGTALRKQEAAPARRTITERRQDDVLRYIEVHLSDPKLSAKMVASACGISLRYLSWLLQVKGTSFSEAVWRQRLEKAKLSLAEADLQERTIAEICYGLGFKSPAHFSRLFKRVFEVSPRDYRQECREKDALAQLLNGELASALLQ